VNVADGTNLKSGGWLDDASQFEPEVNPWWIPLVKWGLPTGTFAVTLMAEWADPPFSPIGNIVAAFGGAFVVWCFCAWNTPAAGARMRNHERQAAAGRQTEAAALGLRVADDSFQLDVPKQLIAPGFAPPGRRVEQVLSGTWRNRTVRMWSTYWVPGGDASSLHLLCAATPIPTATSMIDITAFHRGRKWYHAHVQKVGELRSHGTTRGKPRYKIYSQDPSPARATADQLTTPLLATELTIAIRIGLGWLLCMAQPEYDVHLLDKYDPDDPRLVLLRRQLLDVQDSIAQILDRPSLWG
jgi:hypothetical protein